LGLLCAVGSGLCDVLITRSEQSYRVSVCELETSTVRRTRPYLACNVTEKWDVMRAVSLSPATVSNDLLMLLSRIEASHGQQQRL